MDPTPDNPSPTEVNTALFMIVETTKLLEQYTAVIGKSLTIAHHAILSQMNDGKVDSLEATNYIRKLTTQILHKQMSRGKEFVVMCSAAALHEVPVLTTFDTSTVKNMLTEETQNYSISPFIEDIINNIISTVKILKRELHEDTESYLQRVNDSGYILVPLVKLIVKAEILTDKVTAICISESTTRSEAKEIAETLSTCGKKVTQLYETLSIAESISNTERQEHKEIDIALKLCLATISRKQAELPE